MSLPKLQHGRSISSLKSLLLSRDVAVTVGAFGAAYAWLDIWVKLSQRGFDPKLSRKIIHTGSAPLFMLLWPLYSNHPNAQIVASVVPFLQACRLVYAGKLRVRSTVEDGKGRGDLDVVDGGIAKAISRSG